MLLNPLATSVQTRAGIPMLPGAFPGIGHLPAFFSAAPELLAEGRRRLGTLFWLYRLILLSSPREFAVYRR